jgi:hypothetical protein
MSRSNPNDNGAANPSTRWFEWNGENGLVRYYDKEAKRSVDVGDKFAFVLLDQLGGVRGWDEKTKSGIYSNEVKDTRAEVMVVKSFKGGIIAEGIYRDIKDRVNAAGGKFNASCYLAFTDETGTLSIGCLRFKGAALGSWMEFTKANRGDIYEKGIRINGSVTDKKGRIVYHLPVLEVTELSAASNTAATALDKTLQEYLTAYLKKNKRAQAEESHLRDEDVVPDRDAPDHVDAGGGPTYEDDIQFARMGGF